MLTVTKLQELLKTKGIYMPLPWVDYEGAFCCNSCVGYELGNMRDEGKLSEYFGAVWFCEQSLEPDKYGEWEQKMTIWFNHDSLEDDNESLQQETSQTFKDLLDAEQVDYSWDGSQSKRFKVTLATCKGAHAEASLMLPEECVDCGDEATCGDCSCCYGCCECYDEDEE